MLNTKRLGKQRVENLQVSQSNLIGKDPDSYFPLGPGVPPDLDYGWPV